MQSDCSNTDRSHNLVLTACVPDGGASACVYQVPFRASCQPDEPQVSLQVNVSPSITQNIGSFFLRSFYPEQVSGAGVACAAIQAEADQPLPDGGSSLDADPSLNFAFWGGFRVQSGAGSHTLLVTTPLVAGPGQVLYLEAYSGGIDNTTQQALGQRIGAGCVSQDVQPTSTAFQTIDINLQ
jgi:hypothetical protein